VTRRAAGRPRLSVVIPAYNEELRLGPTLKKVCVFLDRRRQPYEVLVVDDGSRDRTRDLVRSLARARSQIRLVENGFNLGKGAAVRQGVMRARAEAVLFTDADLSTPIEELDRFWPCLATEGGDADLIVGSRALSGSHVTRRQPLYRQTMGKIFNLMVRLVAVKGIKDTQCGFKLFTRSLGRRLFPLQRVPRFGFDVEFLYLARKFGYRVAEKPVTWVNSPESKVNPVADASQMFFDLLLIRLNDWQGKYDTVEKVV
jgi:dolichyl-phosphate beta-glucosyltransferase